MISEAEILRRREEYFALETDQEKADYLWEFRHGGAVLRLNPFQYPKCPPRHKRCPSCGGLGIKKRVAGNGLAGSEFQIICEQCGARTKRQQMAWSAWRDWDDGKTEPDFENQVYGQISIFDLLEGE